MSKCDICGKFYKSYPILLCDNPVCFAGFITTETKENGTRRSICKDCRGKEKNHSE
jgi:hypothetical protein